MGRFLLILTAMAASPGACENRAGQSRPPASADHGAAKRIPDSVSERTGSLPGVDRESDRENIERRFGFEAAREKRLQDDAAKSAQKKRVDLVEKATRDVHP